MFSRIPFLLFGYRQWEAVTLLSTGLCWGIAVPDHSDYSNDHTQNNMQIETFFSKEEETHDQHQDCLHVTEYLKWYGCESADADELAEVRPYCNCAWQNYEYLQIMMQIWAVRAFCFFLFPEWRFLKTQTHSERGLDLSCAYHWSCLVVKGIDFFAC